MIYTNEIPQIEKFCCSSIFVAKSSDENQKHNIILPQEKILTTNNKNNQFLPLFMHACAHVDTLNPDSCSDVYVAFQNLKPVDGLPDSGRELSA